MHLKDASFTYQFAEVFNGRTFWRFLRLLVRRYRGRKVFLIIDNAPCHNLDEDGVRWLSENRHRISLHRLPPYSPEFNPVEPIWKTTRKLATHNRFYKTTIERDTALRRAFQRFYANPDLISAHLERFQ